jgi:SAM-dependent methyltransferase
MSPVNKQALRPCPVCHGAEATVLHCQQLQQPDDSPLPGEYDVVACPACGFVYADTPASQAAYDRYYAEHSKYEDPTLATGGGAGSFDRRRLDLLADRIAARAASTARILDVGCAGGGLLEALQRRGFKSLHGVDAAPECIRRVREMNIEATQATLSQLSTAAVGGPFDIIVLSHVLEHVVDLRSLMTFLVTQLASGGRIYAETPDAARYADFPFVPYYFFDSEHINHFDTTRLKALGQSFGLDLQAEGRIDLDVAPSTRYPACWAWLARSSRGAPHSQVADQELAAAVTRYVNRCKNAEVFPELRHLASTRRPVIVWGAGSFAQRLFGNSMIRRCNVIAIVDRDCNKQGLKFSGFAVQAPEAVLAARPDAVVVIAAAIHGPSIAAEIARSWPNATTLLPAASGPA